VEVVGDGHNEVESISDFSTGDGDSPERR
jgi:hypothetical protein